MVASEPGSMLSSLLNSFGECIERLYISSDDADCGDEFVNTLFSLLKTNCPNLNDFTWFWRFMKVSTLWNKSSKSFSA